MSGRTIHCCLDIRGALRQPKKKLGLMFITDGGRRATWFEAQETLFNALSRGHKVLPIGDPCDGFDYQTGCPGHGEVGP